MALSNAKIVIYTILANALKQNLGASYNLAIKPASLKMLEAEAGGDGSTDKTAVFVGWFLSHPLAMKFLTGTSIAATNFQKVIDGTVTFTTAADALPSTYIALHNEVVVNEPALAGLLALRAAGVDSTFKDDGANLGAGTSGTVLSDAYVMGLYSSWGATKFNNILNTNVLKAVVNETNTSYYTLAQIATLYTTWTHTAVTAQSFFAGLNKLVNAGVTDLKVSDLLAYADSTANFALYTSDPVITLMTSSGGTFAGVAALSASTLADLTIPNAITAIKSCGANFTSLSAVHTADTTKYFSLLSNNAISLAKLGYSGVDFAGLSTIYGTTYTLAKDVEFNALVNPVNADLLKNGVTLAHLKAAYEANVLNDFTPAVKTILATDVTDYDTNFNALVTMTTSSDYAGLQNFHGISF